MKKKKKKEEDAQKEENRRNEFSEPIKELAVMFYAKQENTNA